MIRVKYCYIFMVFITLISVFETFCVDTDRHFVFVSASYNNAEWCERSLASVFDQEHTNWSMIVQQTVPELLLKVMLHNGACRIK